MNPYSQYHSSGSGIVCEFDECLRLFLGCHISASEEIIGTSLSLLTFRKREIRVLRNYGKHSACPLYLSI